eukprot:Gb_05397 [translate_table: standard]
MSRYIKSSSVSLKDAVKLETDSTANKVSWLWNLNQFLYEEVICIRKENKSLKENLNQIATIIESKRKARERLKLKPRGISLKKVLLMPIQGGAPLEESQASRGSTQYSKTD